MMDRCAFEKTSDPFGDVQPSAHEAEESDVFFAGHAPSRARALRMLYGALFKRKVLQELSGEKASEFRMRACEFNRADVRAARARCEQPNEVPV
jgi:hypothetical protein